MSRTSWGDIARQAILRADLSIPEGATLKERMAAIDAAYPFGARSRWPYRAWCKARRRYLIPYGYKPPKRLAPSGQGSLLDQMPRDPATGRPVIR